MSLKLFLPILDSIDGRWPPLLHEGHIWLSMRDSHATCQRRKFAACFGNSMLNNCANTVRWEHFQHDADIGIRGIGSTKRQAFEQAALALTAVITAPEKIQALIAIDINCGSTDDDFLFLDWINALIFEMATRTMLFSRFQVLLNETTLSATAWGEPVDIARHCPAVEPKGATFTELAVRQLDNGSWIAQCVVDV